MSQLSPSTRWLEGSAEGLLEIVATLKILSGVGVGLGEDAMLHHVEDNFPKIFGTPQQAHGGLRGKIIEERRTKMSSQLRRRREENQRQKSGVQKTNNNEILQPSLPPS